MKKLLARRNVVLVTLGVVCAGGVGGVAYALTSGGPGASAASSAAPPAASTSSAGTQGAGGAKGLAGRLDRLVARAVEAQIVVPASGGGYRTLDLDRGTVTSITSTSVTVDPLDAAAPVTASIVSSTRQPKNTTLSDGQTVVLLTSNGDAVLIRPATAASSSSVGTGAGSPGSTTSTTSTT